MQDVSEEHARKTITVDPFPHTAVRSASIHPCKHAAVMQKLGALAETGGKPFRVERRGARLLALLRCACGALAALWPCVILRVTLLDRLMHVCISNMD